MHGRPLASVRLLVAFRHCPAIAEGIEIIHSGGARELLASDQLFDMLSRLTAGTTAVQLAIHTSLPNAADALNHRDFFTEDAAAATRSAHSFPIASRSS